MGERHIIGDHRGRKVGLCDFKSLPPEMPEKVRNEIGHAAGQQLSGRLWGVACLAGAMLSQIGIIVFLGSLNDWDIVVRIGIFAAGGILLIGWWAVRGNTRSAAAIRRCITWGACPACGYPLAASKVEPDGCRVCSECGAAWRG